MKRERGEEEGRQRGNNRVWVRDEESGKPETNSKPFH